MVYFVTRHIIFSYRTVMVVTGIVWHPENYPEWNCTNWQSI